MIKIIKKQKMGKLFEFCCINALHIEKNGYLFLFASCKLKIL